MTDWASGTAVGTAKSPAVALRRHLADGPLLTLQFHAGGASGEWGTNKLTFG